MTFAASEKTNQALATFRQFDVDTQLALLWYGYLDIKDELQPGDETGVESVATALYDQIQAQSQQDQLDRQREIASGADTPVSRSYSSLSSSGKLFLWLKLAQGMERGDIIGLPENYQLPAETNDFTNQVKQLNFEQRLNFMRSIVVEMGTEPLNKGR